MTWRVYQRGGSTFTAGVAPILPPDAYFFTVRVAGSQVGVGSITVDTLADGVQVTERLGLDLPLHPGSARSQYTSQYTIGTNLRLRDFRVTSPGRADPVVQQGIIEGDSSITISFGTGGPGWRVPVRPGALIPPLAAPVALALQQKLQRGQLMTIPVFDPLTLDEDTIALTVLDDSVFLVPDSADFDSLGGAWVPAHSDSIRAWKLHWANGRYSQQMWVDGRGLPIQVTSSAGLVLERSAFEIVTINYRRRRGLSRGVRDDAVIPQTTVAAGVEPERSVTSMRVRFASEGRLWRLSPDTLNPATQFMEGDIAVVNQIGYNPGGSPPAPDSSVMIWLADAPLLGLADSAITRQAAAILGDERNASAIVARLVRWVSRNIARRPDPLVPRAATVLRERQADVDGHTLLFVALARVSGLPARPVSGILLAGDRFYLHSWAEVFLGQWVPVDPTWGELPAAANRVRIATGTLARPLDLLPLVAGLDVELISLNQLP